MWDLLGNAGQKCDYSKWECFATMNSSFAMRELGGVLWRRKKDEQERGEETETVAMRVCGCGCETRENNSTLPKLAKIGLGRSG